MNERTQFCAGIKGKDSCRGDSGGALMIKTSSGKFLQVGVVSFGSIRCGNGFPAVYTKVSAYATWIKQTLEP